MPPSPAAPSILVTDPLGADGLARLRDAGFEVLDRPGLTGEELIAALANCEGWLIRSASKASADIIARAPKLRVIGRAGVGVDNVDVDAATHAGIVVMNAPGGNTISTAEHTIAMMLALARKIPAAAASMKAGKWDRKSFTGVELEGKTIGIIGLGRVGQAVLKRVKSFGMEAIAFDPFLPKEHIERLGAAPVSVDELCSRADVITVHTPLTAETKSLIDARRLATMKPSTMVINCARGGIVDEAALADALTNKKIAGAALDVYGEEPLPAEHPFRKLDNIVLTPHLAASTREAQENVALEVADQVIAFLRDGVVRNAVNAPSLDGELLATLRPYLILAEKLGAFLSQFADSAPRKLEVQYVGAITSQPISALTAAAVRGFLTPNSDTVVTIVNAPTVARERGIEIVESRGAATSEFKSLVTLTVTQDNGHTHRVAGTVFEPNRPRIVLVNDKNVDAWPYGNVLVIENRDIPGIVGRVGTLLGSHDINIAQMTWGRTERDNTALTVINLDQRVPAEVLTEIRGLSDILSVRAMNL